MFRFKWVQVAAVFLLLAAPVAIVTTRDTRVAAVPCPCYLLPQNPTPQGTDTHANALEVGFKFRPSIDGYITGVRFYKMAGMTGTHTGSLWDNMGNRLATATFDSETASGWQQVNFSSPVAVTANTLYTASTYMANGVYAFTTNYYTSPVTNYPLTAPANGTPQAADGFGQSGQGVADLSGTSVYPTSSFNSANYWVDVAFAGAQDNDPPTVSAVSPTSAATDVNIGSSVTATFDINMLEASLTVATFNVRDSQNNPVAGTVSYNAAAKAATFTPSAPLSTNMTYTATLEGGSGAVVKSLDDIALTSDYTWSFTTAATDECPCSLKNRAGPAGSVTSDEAVGRELGVKIVPKANGYINAIRFYKPIIATETTHTGNIWNASGTNLASVTFTDESEYGWQEAKLSTPLAVTQGQLYIVSYGTTEGIYVANSGAISSDMNSNSLTAYATGSSQNAAAGSGNANGVFSTPAGSYPNTGSPSAAYYWVDVVFSTNSGALSPLSPTLTQPKNNAYGVKRDGPITAQFARPLNAATVTGSTVRLFDDSNNQVSGTVSYNTASREISFAPSASLAYGQKYTVKLSASIADTGGAALGSEYTWSFTVGTQLLSDPATGQGGPILVVTSTANKYSTYYAEILRAEGLNYFDTRDLSTLNSSILSGYDAVVMAEMPLSQAQADMLSDWVTGGGDLVAMRPDKKLATLLGLTDAASTRANQYLQIDTASSPGTGIVSETIQYKGTADNYTLNGATAIANFFSDASTGTSNPAVTTRSVGSNGGTAMAFTYDLAKSVIALHQGNQAWAGQDRDGSGSRRTNDLFFGAMSGDVQPDWVDLNKIHIPQADEQQRLLANMLTAAAKDKKPLPRFWYLPHGHTAAMVLAGDDHGLGNEATERVLNNWLNESPTNCSPIDWECVRASHYTYATSALTNARAVQYTRLRHEIGAHVANGGGCNDYSSFANLSTIYTNELATWRAKYTGVPNQRTTRFHCYIWSDWDSQPRVEMANGMRYTLEYVAYPGSWINGRAPLLTGSGMNMRLTDADGDMLDSYQGVTNFDDTAANTTAINTLLDNAIGSAGYYGIFGTHYDMSDAYDQTVYAAAKARNIPMISADNALTWLDGRGSSTFSNFTGSNGQFSFTVNAAEGASGLKAMLPLQDAGGTLNTLTLGGNAVTSQTQTVKGVQYAVFDAVPGTYTATYSDYNPGSGNNGGGNNGGNNGGTDGGGTGAVDQNKKVPKKNTGLFNESPSDVVIVTGQNPEQQPAPSTPTQNQPTPREKELIQNGNDKKGSPVGLWIGGFSLAALIGGLLWFIAARRRRRDQPQW